PSKNAANRWFFVGREPMITSRRSDLRCTRNNTYLRDRGHQRAVVGSKMLGAVGGDPGASVVTRAGVGAWRKPSRYSSAIMRALREGSRVMPTAVAPGARNP